MKANRTEVCMKVRLTNILNEAIDYKDTSFDKAFRKFTDSQR